MEQLPQDMSDESTLLWFQPAAGDPAASRFYELLDAGPAHWSGDAFLELVVRLPFFAPMPSHTQVVSGIPVAGGTNLVSLLRSYHQVQGERSSVIPPTVAWVVGERMAYLRGTRTEADIAEALFELWQQQQQVGRATPLS
jgi:hypothetical protein